MQEHHTHLTGCAEPPDCGSSAESPGPIAWTRLGSPQRDWMHLARKKFPSLLPNRGDSEMEGDLLAPNPGASGWRGQEALRMAPTRQAFALPFPNSCLERLTREE